jgi:hypothetical protein
MMRRSWRLLVAVVVLGLAASACSPQELAEIFAVNDLSASQNPVKVAAGAAAKSRDQDRAAQQLADEGLREKSKDKLERAAALRPTDVRYGSYLAAYSLAEGNKRQFMDEIGEINSIVIRESSKTIANLGLDENSNEARRIKKKMDIDAARHLLEAVDWALVIEYGRSPQDPERVKNLEKAVCTMTRVYLKAWARVSGDAPIPVLLSGASCPDNK